MSRFNQEYKTRFNQVLSALRSFDRKSSNRLTAAKEVAEYVGGSYKAIEDWIRGTYQPLMPSLLLLEGFLRKKRLLPDLTLDGQSSFTQALEIAVSQKSVTIDELAETYGTNRNVVMKWFSGRAPIDPCGVFRLVKLLSDRDMAVAPPYEKLSPEIAAVGQVVGAGIKTPQEICEILKISSEDLRRLLRGSASPNGALTSKIQTEIVPLAPTEAITPVEREVDKTPRREDRPTGQPLTGKTIAISVYEDVLIDALKLVRAIGGDFLDNSNRAERRRFQLKAGTLPADVANIAASFCSEHAFESRKKFRGKGVIE